MLPTAGKGRRRLLPILNPDFNQDLIKDQRNPSYSNSSLKNMQSRILLDAKACALVHALVWDLWKSILYIFKAMFVFNIVYKIAQWNQEHEWSLIFTEKNNIMLTTNFLKNVFWGTVMKTTPPKKKKNVPANLDKTLSSCKTWGGSKHDSKENYQMTERYFHKLCLSLLLL